mmetsp:Transcript_73210/g.190709  ORF Transcript_73210/g.190709 Transcript_73210/m.190709 type:complete len:105 (-) Transcript_73210:119-433(-)
MPLVPASRCISRCPVLVGASGLLDVAPMSAELRCMCTERGLWAFLLKVPKLPPVLFLGVATETAGNELGATATRGTTPPLMANEATTPECVCTRFGEAGDTGLS